MSSQSLCRIITTLQYVSEMLELVQMHSENKHTAIWHTAEKQLDESKLLQEIKTLFLNVVCIMKNAEKRHLKSVCEDFKCFKIIN